MHFFLWLIIASLSITQCSLFKSRKTVFDPLANFYTTEIPKHTQVSLSLIERSRDQIKEEQFELAIENLNKALSIDPYNPFSYYFLGLVYYQKRQHKKSLEFLSKAIPFSQKFSFWKAQEYFLLGLNFRALSKKKEAQHYFKKAQAIDSELDPEVDFPLSD